MPSPPSDFAHVLAGELAALVVVGRDEADEVAALQTRSRRSRPEPRCVARSITGATSADSSSGASAMPDDAARDGVLDLGDLRVAIVLAQRPAPRDVDAELLRRSPRPGMDALPEDVRRALRNHGDGHVARRRACAPLQADRDYVSES